MSKRHLRFAVSSTGLLILACPKCTSQSALEVVQSPMGLPHGHVTICASALTLRLGLCSSLGLRAAAERGGWTPLLPPGGPPAVPSLPPAAPAARPTSLSCSARHRALSRGWEPDPGAVCVRVCVQGRERALWVTRASVGALCQGGCGCHPIPPPLATELLSEGPAPRRSCFYLFTVCASSGRFLPSGFCRFPRPAIPALCSGTPAPPASGEGRHRGSRG